VPSKSVAPFGATRIAAAMLTLLTGAVAAQESLPRLAVETYPPPAREQIGRVYQKAEAARDNAAAVGALARVLHAWSQWEPAHQTYARAQALAPGTFEWHYLDGFVLERLTRHAEAAEQFRQAAALSPSYLPARVKLAEELLEAGDREHSAPLFQQLARDPAAEPAAELGLGRIAALDGRHDAAIAHLERATTLFPQFGAAYYALARSYRAVGRLDDAQRALARQTQYGPQWPAIGDPVLAGVLALREDASALMDRGIKAAEAGDVAAAIAAHEAALEANPELVQAHVNLISLYGRAGKRAKAEEHYRAVVARGVSLDVAHYDYGVLLGMENDWDGAADAYRKAIAVNPNHVRARNNLGQILERQQKLQEAADQYRRAVDIQPTFRVARFNLGRMLIALGRPQEAIHEFERLVEQRDAETPTYLYALATAHVRSGHLAEGARLAAQARDLARDYGQSELAAAIDRDLARIK